MKYFTKEWYIKTHTPQKTQDNKVEKNSRRRRRNKDNTMRDYHKYLNKIEDSLPECLRSTLHGNIITSAEYDNDTFVISFDNSGGFSDVEKMYLYDAQIIEKECELSDKKWLYGEFSVVGAGFSLSALLADDTDNLYYLTVSFSNVECSCTLFTDSTDAGICETLESILDISAEESLFKFSKPDWDNFLCTLQKLASYKISNENLYRYEAGVYCRACDEYFEMSVTRQVICRSAIYQLYISFTFAVDEQFENISDMICSDAYDSFDEFINAIKESQSFLHIKENGQLIKYSIDTEEI